MPFRIVVEGLFDEIMNGSSGILRICIVGLKASIQRNSRST